MGTKYILHGGFKPGAKQENDAFFSEILREAPKPAKVLLVYFAKESDRVEKNKLEDIEQFNKNKGDKILSFEVATEELFIEQVRNADIVYLHGGTTFKLLDSLKQFSDLASLFRGKIIVGDSAGANVLCAAFYSLKNGPGEGFGLLLFKIICHYVEENKHKLDDIKPSLETFLLREYEFKVFWY